MHTSCIIPARPASAPHASHLPVQDLHGILGNPFTCVLRVPLALSSLHWVAPAQSVVPVLQVVSIPYPLALIPPPPRVSMPRVMVMYYVRMVIYVRTVTLHMYPARRCHVASSGVGMTVYPSYVQPWESLYTDSVSVCRGLEALRQLLFKKWGGGGNPHGREQMTLLSEMFRTPCEAT